MSSIINATTTAGVTVTGDNSGSLQLATNNGTTALTINTSQQVGIGSGTPSGILHTFKANTDSTVNFEATTAGYASNLQLIANNSAGGSYNNLTSFAGATALWRIGGGGVADTITFSTGSSVTERMRISSGGNLLVGTTSVPNAGNAIACFGGFYAFCLNSGSFNYYFGTDSNNFNVYSGDGVLRGYLGTAGAWTNTSDIAFKKDIVDIKYSLQDALNLRPVSYLTKDYEIPQIGFIAQEMEQVIPEVVSGKDGEKGISYGSLVALCVKAIQDLNAKVDAQDAAIQELKAELDATKAEVQALKGVA